MTVIERAVYLVVTWIVCCCMAWSAEPSANQRQRAFLLAKSAAAAAARQDYATACSKYEEALRLCPNYQVVKIELAKAYSGLTRSYSVKEALPYLKRACELDSCNAEVKARYSSYSRALSQRAVMDSDGAVSGVSSDTNTYTVDSSTGRPIILSDSTTKSARAKQAVTQAPEPRSYFIAQNQDPRWNRDAPVSDANCCPTCLAMACRRFGIFPSGMNSNTPVQQLILGVRQLMSASDNQNQGTNAQQMLSGAQSLGLYCELVETLPDIDGALARGAVINIRGSPWVDRSYGPRYGGGQKYLDPSSIPMGHCVLVVGREGGYYIVNDPGYFDGPISVSASELEAFLSFRGRGRAKGEALSP